MDPVAGDMAPAQAVSADDWELYADDQEHWHWRQLAADGSLLCESQRGFEFYLDCLENAKRYGYFAFEMPDI